MTKLFQEEHTDLEKKQMGEVHVTYFCMALCACDDYSLVGNDMKRPQARYDTFHSVLNRRWSHPQQCTCLSYKKECLKRVTSAGEMQAAKKLLLLYL
jgi:hypothetical protein